ncbi:hypothetical protein [Flavobacterium sp. GSB-24]|uniref:hypothetical protein n=1 Tax=Flavobacterium sp. GSB-24 TaxID=2994319 RepID=UPI00248FBA1B|nr:hypothetical protein [Flavobacterium sp. GSB-24]BDU25197.1 hypothetical protein FLGSB24_19410 [Flavobacterium sp. GSB-24]
MTAEHDLDTLSKILSDKGYNGYFLTQGAYPGKIRESILEYLHSCEAGLDKLKPEFILSGYPQWLGDDKPRVECHMWIKQENGGFDLQKMEVIRKDQFGQSLAQAALSNLSATTVPTKNEAIAMVSESITQKSAAAKKHFRM